MTLVIGLAILSGLKALEGRLHAKRQGTLTVVMKKGVLSESELSAKIAAGGGGISRWLEATLDPQAHVENQSFEVKWKQPPAKPGLPRFLELVSSSPGVMRVEWKFTSKG